MSQLRDLIQRHPRFAFSTQYVTLDENWNSVVAFHNYFDEIFPGKQITAELLLVFHNHAGHETLVHTTKVAPSASVQLDCRALGVHASGIVALAAIPEFDLTALSEGRLKIRPQVTTGFYITWDRGGRWRDTMHEWTDVSLAPPKISTQHVGFAAVYPNIECGMILMNTSLSPVEVSTISLTLCDRFGRQAAASVRVPALPPMGSRMMKLSEHFPGFEELLRKHSSLVVGVTSRSHSPPLTAEWHPSGDFHFHHI